MRRIAEFVYDMLRVVDRCKLKDYEAGDAIAFTEGYQAGAGEGTNPYVEGTVRHVMWKQGEVASIVEGGVKYE